MKIYVNNVERVTRALNLKKGLKKVRLRPLFSEKRLKIFLKKIPYDCDPYTLRKFEEETGIVLKYYVFNDKYDFREFTKNGVYPNPKFNVFEGHIDYEEFMSYYLEDYDILVIR